MPIYEMPVLLRIMNKTDYILALKRVTNAIFETGGFIRKLENWGEKDLPCKATSHGKTHKRAGYFFLCFDVPPSSIKDLIDEYKRDVDIVRVNIFKQNTESDIKCTIEEELLPAPYRPSVTKLLKMASRDRNEKNKFKSNSGLDYYPFLK
ncbi:mitochondrial ribosomal protein S6 [Ptiloglossa arizonensis]|uniref:mitochondrial ribosomal protein S6 n=1 Tax=Ptiloglossa arizonensis TaxID=3350558 RepID=UPI003F9F5FE1